MIKKMATYNIQIQDIFTDETGSNYPDGRWLYDKNITTIISDAVAGCNSNGGHLSDGAYNFAAYLEHIPLVLSFVQNYLIPRFFDCVVLSVTENPTGDAYQNKLLSILYFLDSTKDKHIKVIEAIEGAGDLMKSVSSISKNIFNDTPQTPDPDLDTHVTNYTKSISESDFNTPMARIAEIRDTFLNEMELWSREFMERFIIF